MTDDRALPFPLYCFLYYSRDGCLISHLAMPDGKRIVENSNKWQLDKVGKRVHADTLRLP